MAETRFHAQLRVKIEEAIDTMAGSIASGACSNYEQYCKKVGFIDGLKAANEFADEVEKEYE